jgi:regulator of protease activity HflC (stomatin/prohibitin superfamily)
LEAVVTPFTIFVIAIVVVVFLFVIMAVKSVPQGHEWTIERFGRYTGSLRPGLGFIVPFIDRIGAKINMMESVLDVPTQEVITKDNAMVSVDGVVLYQVLDAAKAAYEVNNLENAILNLTMTNIRTVMGSMDLDELLSQRDKINVQLLHVVDDATRPWGIKVTRIEIKDIAPPRDLVDSMARQMKAEREKRAQILEAEGEREAAFRQAEARERLAEAEAKATQMVSDAIAKGSVQAVNYFLGVKYVEALQKVASAPNQKVIMIPLDAANVIGALGGIAELAKDAMQTRTSGRGNGGTPGGSPAGGSPTGGGPWQQPRA